MEDFLTNIYTGSKDLPGLSGNNFFHSRSLFEIYERTPRHTPYMVVARDARGVIVGHLLAVVRSRMSWLPPYIYWHCRILGEGDYDCFERAADGLPVAKERIFGAMLGALTRKLQYRVLYIEMSNLSAKMFGYKEFRRAYYFPVRWMSIHNSLHSKPAEERLTGRMLSRIANSHSRGAWTEEVSNGHDFSDFIRLLRKHNRFKPRRFVPDERFFRELMARPNCHLMITKYKNRPIGCSAFVYSEGNAYMWFSAFRRKSYVMLHPDDVTVFDAIKKAQTDGCQHIFFLDVGLPFSRNPYREFILRFGGKPVSTYRWFHFTIRWVNRLLSWIYRD